MRLSHYLSCLSLAVLGSASFAAHAGAMYTLVPVGSLGGGGGSGAARGLNNRGQVVGYRPPSRPAWRDWRWPG